MSILRDLGLCAVPQRKLLNAQLETLQSCDTCKDKKLNEACQRCGVFNAALTKYTEANIPVKYWKLEMNKDFVGDTVLMDKYKELTANVKQTYDKGVAICFMGGHGTGKTLTTSNVLKRVLEKGYSGLYVNLTDVITSLVSNFEGRAQMRSELLTVDFLVIDEFDPRYMGSDNASDLFGRVLEDIIRIRAQNSLPMFMCTNSPNVVESFNGPLKQSITSLMNYFTNVSVLGKDQRKSGL